MWDGAFHGLRLQYMLRLLIYTAEGRKMSPPTSNVSNFAGVGPASAYITANATSAFVGPRLSWDAGCFLSQYPIVISC